jgi:hypothetical protein
VAEPEATAEEETAPEAVSPPQPEATTGPETASGPPPPPAPAAKPAAIPTLEADPATGLITATVDELSAAFAADRAATNARLTDTTLKLTGIVEKVFIRDHLNIRYALLTGTSPAASSARCSFDHRCSFDQKHGSQLSGLTAGDQATIQGKYSGYERNIILTDCTLVR